MIAALDDKQRAQTVIGERPQGKLLLGPGRDGKTIDPKGVKGSTLTVRQQELFLDVIAAWVNIVEPETAKARMAAITDRIKDAYFAWSGSTEFAVVLLRVWRTEADWPGMCAGRSRMIRVCSVGSVRVPSGP